MADSQTPRRCKRGHELIPENLSPQGKCKLCRREREGYAGGIPNTDKTRCKNDHPLIGANLGVYTDKDGKAHRYCRRCYADRARSYYWNRYKAIKHPRNKPGRPRKY